MKSALICGSISLSFFLATAPALAMDTTIGLLGDANYWGLLLERSSATPGSAWGVQVVYSRPFSSVQNVALWGTYDWPLFTGTSFGLLLGGSYSGIFGPDPNLQDLMLATGLSLSTESGPFYLRLRPHWVHTPLAPSLQSLSDIYMRSGIPWAEFGIHLSPRFELSLRYAETPVRLAWRF